MVQRCIPLIVSRIVCALPSHCVCVTLTVLFVSSNLRIPLSHRPTRVSLVAIPSRSPAKGEERSPADRQPKERSDPQQIPSQRRGGPTAATHVRPSTLPMKCSRSVHMHGDNRPTSCMHACAAYALPHTPCKYTVTSRRV